MDERSYTKGGNLNVLQNKTILITGSSRGIGAATAKLAVEYGAKVILHGKTMSDHLVALSNDLTAPFMVCDVSKQDEVAREVEAFLGLGHSIDCLVNNAGACNPKPFLETTREDWLIAFETNLMSMVYFSQLLIPHMVHRGGGSIVNISSIRGHVGGAHPSRPPYSVTKAGVINLTATLAKEFAPEIRVNSVSPGAVLAGMAQSWSDAVRTEHMSVPLKRIGIPHEIAELVLFLASDKSSFVTGQDFVIDGGYLLGKPVI